MATFVIFAESQHARRPDGRNTFVVQGADEPAARAAAEALIGQPHALDEFRVVRIDEATPAFLVEGGVPIGVREQSTWSKHGRGGDFLQGA